MNKKISFYLAKYRQAESVKNNFIWANQFYEFIGDVPVNQIRLKDINEKYLNYLQDPTSKGIGRRLKLNTVGYRLKGARFLFEYISKYEKLNFEPKDILDRKIFRDNKTQFNSLKTEDLSVAEFNKLRRVLIERINADSITGLRDRLAVEVMAATGMTITELRQLKRTDFISEKRTITISHYGKKFNYKNRSFRLKPSEIVFLWLERYFAMRTDSSDLLFVSYKTNRLDVNTAPIQARSIQRMVQSLREEANIKRKITPESLRATLMIKKIIENIGITEFREFFGYSASTSRAYYNIFPAAMKELGVNNDTHIEIKAAVLHYNSSLDSLYKAWRSGHVKGQRVGEQIWLLRKDLERRA